LVRNQAEFQRIANYIELHPVKAGLVSPPEELPRSRARPIAHPPQVTHLPHMKNAH